MGFVFETKQLAIKAPFLQGDIPEISLGISEKVVFKGLSCSVSNEQPNLNPKVGARRR